MRSPQPRAAYALIELPMVLVLLAFAGLFVAFVFSYFTGPAPWYAWCAAAVVLPMTSVALVVIMLVIDSLKPRPKLNEAAKPDSPSPTRRDS